MKRRQAMGRVDKTDSLDNSIFQKYPASSRNHDVPCFDKKDRPSGIKKDVVKAARPAYQKTLMKLVKRGHTKCASDSQGRRRKWQPAQRTLPGRLEADIPGSAK